jgi:hypothetical protein
LFFFNFFLLHFRLLVCLTRSFFFLVCFESSISFFMAHTCKPPPPPPSPLGCNVFFISFFFFPLLYSIFVWFHSFFFIICPPFDCSLLSLSFSHRFSQSFLQQQEQKELTSSFLFLWRTIFNLMTEKGKKKQKCVGFVMGKKKWLKFYDFASSVLLFVVCALLRGFQT